MGGTELGLVILAIAATVLLVVALAFVRRRRGPAARRPSRPPDRRFRLAVAGESFGDRQKVIARLKAGDPVRLVPEPDNPHDPFAIRVEARGGMIGYVPARNAARLASELDGGARVRATIERIARSGGGPAGVLLSLELWEADGED